MMTRASSRVASDPRAAAEASAHYARPEMHRAGRTLSARGSPAQLLPNRGRLSHCHRGPRWLAGAQRHCVPLSAQLRHLARERQTSFTASATGTRGIGPDSGGLGSEDVPDPSMEALMFNAPAFPLSSALHPSGTGVLNVFEPRYLEMFRDLQRDTPPGSPAYFVHILDGGKAPPAAMEDSVGGVMRVGVLCEIKHIEETPDNQILVQYEGTRRVSVVSIPQSLPYLILCLEWLDDEATAESAKETEAAQLEKDVWKSLLEVEKLSHAISKRREAAALPAEIAKYAPSLDDNMTSVDYLMKSGHSAGPAISQWIRSGTSTGGPAKTKSKSGNSCVDPYEAVKQAMHPRRRELFSFAAASLLDLRNPEKIALLRSKDTAARLQWVLSAVQPYLLELRTKHSLQRALEGNA